MANDREISRTEARRTVLRELDRRLRRDGRQKPADQTTTTPTRDDAADAVRKRTDER